MDLKRTLPKDQIKEVPESLESLQSALSSLPDAVKNPAGCRLQAMDIELLLFIQQNGSAAHSDWPERYQPARRLERLRQHKYIRRTYWPTRFNLTRFGSSLLSMIHKALEHAQATSAES